MKILRHLQKWEHSFEHKSKSQQLQQLTVSFGIALVAGYLLSLGVQNWQSARIKQIQTEMSRLEKTGMDARIKEWQALRYEK